MEKITNCLISALMLVGGITSALAKYGCCFYIFHQPQLPDALRDVE